MEYDEAAIAARRSQFSRTLPPRYPATSKQTTERDDDSDAR